MSGGWLIGMILMLRDEGLWDGVEVRVGVDERGSMSA